MPRGENTNNHPNRRVDRSGFAARSSERLPTFIDRQTSGSDKFTSPGSGDHPSYQIPEGEIGHPGDVKGAPRRKGTGNILIDPITNTWSNTPQ